VEETVTETEADGEVTVLEPLVVVVDDDEEDEVNDEDDDEDEDEDGDEDEVDEEVCDDGDSFKQQLRQHGEQHDKKKYNQMYCTNSAANAIAHASKKEEATVAELTVFTLVASNPIPIINATPRIAIIITDRVIRDSGGAVNPNLTKIHLAIIRTGNAHSAITNARSIVNHM